MPLRAAVFDFDGVIVDSEPLHFQALQDVLRSDGVEITKEEYVGMYLAFDNRTSIRLALEHHHESADPARIDRLDALKVSRFVELQPQVRTLPGATELVRALGAELPLAIASGALHNEVAEILEAVKLDDAFETIVGADDAPRTKPDPAPYVEAVRRLAEGRDDLSPSDCLAIEDTMAGIASALGAGMTVVGVAHTYPADKLQAAHRVVGSLVDLDVDDLRGLFGD